MGRPINWPPLATVKVTIGIWKLEVAGGADWTNTRLPAPLVPLMGVHKDVEVTPEQETLGVPGGHVEVLVGPSKLAAHCHTL